MFSTVNSILATERSVSEVGTDSLHGSSGWHGSKVPDTVPAHLQYKNPPNKQL